MTPDFDSMDEAEVDPYWCNFETEGYTLELEDEVKAEREGALVGLLTRIQEGVGGNGSRLYTMRTETDPRPIQVWGSGHINQQVDTAGVEPGDAIGILKTGNQIDTGQSEPMQEFDVRYDKKV